MTVTKALGGNRLGSGNKMNVELHNYSRSTHDLSNVFRTTMSCGTLVPFMQHLGLNGDTFDINLNTMVRTLPTTAPLFGSFKIQLDVFMTPIRLYNAHLHMNKQNVGMKMADIKFPMMKVAAKGSLTAPTAPDMFDQSTLMAYLGVRGAPVIKTNGVYNNNSGFLKNALGLLSYWHIYANYYANKQEEIGCVITNESFLTYEITNVFTFSNSIWTERPFDETGTFTPDFQEDWSRISFKFTGILDLENLYLKVIDFPGTAAHNIRVLDYFTIEYITATEVVLLPNFNSSDMKLFQVIPVRTGTGTDKVAIRQFQLKNIDDTHLKILQHAGTEPYVFDEEDKFPYTTCTGTVYPAVYLTNYYSQNGLGIKTYQSDIFNNWLNTEWIDGDTGVNAITAVDTSTGEFKLDTLLLSKKVYNILNRIAVSGGTYEDWQEAVYGESTLRRAETPIYCGGLSTELVFEEVISTADAAAEGVEQPLGTLAGRGTQSGKNKGGNIYIRVEEPSIIMGIVSITPRIDYSQGNDWLTRLTNMDQLHKPGMDGIGFQEAITESMAFWDAEYETTTKEWKYKSAGKQPAWIEYMTNYNKVYGHFANPTTDTLKQCVLLRDYTYDPNSLSIKDLTTYIDPVKFNYAFAVEDLTAQNFWMQIACDIKARRLMSAKVIPNL